MNPHSPNNALRWVDISISALRTALTEASATNESIDIRGNAFGFGRELVEELASDCGLGIDGTSTSWVERAHALHAQVLCARVINVKTVPAGEQVSYGGYFETTAPTTLALISVGFADGVPRLDPVGGEIELSGQRVDIAGRIAMDQLIVDATGLEVSVGDVATVWGGAVSMGEWAGWSSRSVHEISSTLASRVVKRVVE